MSLIAMALAMLAPPDRWVRIGGAELHEEHLDKESVRRSGGKVTLWTRRRSVPDDDTSWNELEIDCSKRTATILAYVRDKGGAISHNVARPHKEASPIVPNSVEERIFNIACR